MDSFEDIEQKLSSLGQDIDIIALGDFNARTATGHDFIRNEDNTNLPDLYDYQVDSIANYPRGNMDMTTNSFGVKLLSLCKSVPLRVCNGRKIGDILGEYTCYKWNGKSTVDYCMVSPRLYPQIQHFFVEKLNPTLSDHCSIVAKLRTKFIAQRFVSSNYEFQEKPVKIRWDGQIAQKFENMLQTPEAKIFITNFVKNGILDNQEGMDSATAFLTDFITNTAIKAGSQGTQIELTPSTQKNHPPGKKGVKKLGGKLCLSGMMKPV